MTNYSVFKMLNNVKSRTQKLRSRVMLYIFGMLRYSNPKHCEIARRPAFGIA